MIWFSPGMPSARKVRNTFIYRKHDALRSMKQGSCITEATLIEIGVILCAISTKASTGLLISCSLLSLFWPASTSSSLMTMQRNCVRSWLGWRLDILRVRQYIRGGFRGRGGGWIGWLAPQLNREKN